MAGHLQQCPRQLRWRQFAISFPGSRRYGYHHAGIVRPDFAGEAVLRELDVAVVQFTRAPDGRLQDAQDVTREDRHAEG